MQFIEYLFLCVFLAVKELTYFLERQDFKSLLCALHSLIHLIFTATLLPLFHKSDKNGNQPREPP